jgi:pimeloyl-ACP methyl ester carboxylesterase
MRPEPRSTLTEPRSTLTLGDGRALGYLDVGAPDGAPLFHFHGHGSSRLEALVLADAARRANLRLLAFDRPGIGVSDPASGDRLLSWPRDVFAAADRLGIDRFAVQGMSAGGAYALACAHAVPERITACSLVSSVPPPRIGRRFGPVKRRLAWWIAALCPTYLRHRLKRFRPDDVPTREVVHARIARMARWLGGEDLRLLQDPEMFDLFARTLTETAAQSNAANREEIERLARPWGFRLRDVSVPVLLWHGGQDRILPIGYAHLMARELRECHTTFYDADGHFSVLVNRAHDLMAALERRASGQAAGGAARPGLYPPD